MSESLLAVYKLPIHLINLLFPFSIFFLSADTFSLFFWQPTSSMQHGVCTSVRENMKNELANQSSHTGEKKLQLCESLLQKEQPEISCATSISTDESQIYKLQCTDASNSPIPVSSSVSDSMDIDGMTNRTEDSKATTLLEINYHQEPKIPVRSDQSKSRFSPLLALRRRIKKKKSSDEIAEEICSPDNKQCSAMACSPSSLSLDATHFLKPEVFFHLILTCIYVMMPNGKFYSTHLAFFGCLSLDLIMRCVLF